MVHSQELNMNASLEMHQQWLHSKVPNGYDLCTLCTCILTIETDINENIMNILNINGKSMHNRSD